MDVLKCRSVGISPTFTSRGWCFFFQEKWGVIPSIQNANLMYNLPLLPHARGAITLPS